ncbi:hypothetical protein K3172_10635 [Qipengyuania sp. 6B39]|uniref:hypothetical protein n=1 Tax=Qipengyuania proteolytica TaxID=2867239 RepID=UPI001C894FEA|nr:hypothetical protein [Qipengyuania proteolytica]MBX7496310.1 hypothetical protein [Qipengyuania proteolytica]
MSEPKPHATLSSFTPVPRRKERSNGWKPEVQRAFIEALADTGSVAAACRMVRRSTHGAYHLRRQPGAEEFAAAWQAALDLGMQRIEDVAMDRALNGVEQPVYSYGKLVGTRMVHNDRLLMFMLRNRAPERFAEGRSGPLGAIGQMQLERYKKQWRKEWEAERAAKATSPAVIRDHIDKKIEAFRAASAARLRAEWMRLTPETRRAYARYEELRARDLGRAVEIPSYLLGETGEPAREDWWEVPETVQAKDAETLANGPLSLPAPEEAEEASEPEGLRIRGLKDSSWD